MSFRENLREMLDFMGMEQKELAYKTGLSLKTIENYVKKDASIPTADKAVLIAQALKVSVEYLVTGKNNEKNDTVKIKARNREVNEIVIKLNNNNHEILKSVAKTLLSLQEAKKG